MKYSDFLLYVLPGVSGCPDFTAERAIRDACIEFCIKTDLWIAEPERLQIVPNVTEYDLSAPSGAEPNHILSLSRSGVTLEPKRFREAFMLNASTTASAPTYLSRNQIFRCRRKGKSKSLLCPTHENENYTKICI